MRNLIALFAILVVVVTACKRSEQATTETTATSTTSSTTTAATPPTTTTAAGADVGQILPPYQAKRLDGSAFDLAGERDKVVLLNVWATWCGPCVYEIPELQALHVKYGPRGFEVVGASVDEGDPADVKAFADEHKMTYPVVLDPEGKVAGLLDASVLPTTVLIDRNGRIVWKKIGAIMPQDDTLTKAIEQALVKS